MCAEVQKWRLCRRASDERFLRDNYQQTAESVAALVRGQIYEMIKIWRTYCIQGEILYFEIVSLRNPFFKKKTKQNKKHLDRNVYVVLYFSCFKCSLFNAYDESNAFKMLCKRILPLKVVETQLSGMASYTQFTQGVLYMYKIKEIPEWDNVNTACMFFLLLCCWQKKENNKKSITVKLIFRVKCRTEVDSWSSQVIQL